MRQFTIATLHHLYDTSRDLTSTRAKWGRSVACVRTSTFFLPGDQWYIHLTLRPPIQYVPGFNIHRAKWQRSIACVRSLLGRPLAHSTLIHRLVEFCSVWTDHILGYRLTWSHITCLSRFHSAPCRSSSSSLHHYLNTLSHWSSRSTVCFLPRGSAVHVLLHGTIYEEICHTFLWDTAHKNSIYWELTSRIHIFMETGLRICIFMEAGLWIYISMRHSLRVFLQKRNSTMQISN
jgi:hypothetical protein